MYIHRFQGKNINSSFRINNDLFFAISSSRENNNGFVYFDDDVLYSYKWGWGDIWTSFKRRRKVDARSSVVTRIVSSLCNISAGNVVYRLSRDRRRNNVISAKAGNRQWDKRPVIGWFERIPGRSDLCSRSSAFCYSWDECKSFDILGSVKKVIGWNLSRSLTRTNLKNFSFILRIFYHILLQWKMNEKV